MTSINQGLEEMYGLGDDGDVLEADQSDIMWSDSESILSSTSRGASTASSIYSSLTQFTYEHGTAPDFSLVTHFALLQYSTHFIPILLKYLLTTRITLHSTQTGRRYHAFRERIYNLPNDEEEQERLDVVHHQHLTIFDGKLHLCPLSNPRRILDVGTGTGIWATDMANLYETAEVIGTDLSPIQSHWVPPNCRFEVDDVESEWCFAKESFDMIHSRHISFAIKDWQRFVEQIYDHLVPGGWVQLCEHDFWPQSDNVPLPEACTIRKMLDGMAEALRKIGIDYSPHKMRTYLERQGFVDIHEVQYEIPLGLWPRDEKLKEIGRYTLLLLEMGATEAFRAMFTRALGWPVEETTELLKKANEEIRSQKYHLYFKGIVLIARKPRVGR